MARAAPSLPLLDASDAPAPVRDALAGEPPLEILRALAHAETAFVPWLAYGTALLTQLRLPASLRELAMLQAARLSPDGSYEWAQHVALARACGVTAEQIQAVADGRTEAPCFDAVERTVLAATACLVREGVLGDAHTEQLRERLSVRELVELILVVGNVMMLSRVSASFGLRPEAPAGDVLLRRRDAVPDPSNQE